MTILRERTQTLVNAEDNGHYLWEIVAAVA